MSRDRGTAESFAYRHWRSLLLAAVLLPVTAGAAPQYFTFQGNLDYRFGPQAGGIAFQPATFVFVVDRAATGTITETDGDVLLRVDDAQYDYYYADLYFGSVSYPGIYQSHILSRNYGRDTLSPFDFPEPTDLFTRNHTQLHLAYDNLFELVPGQTFDSSSWIDVRWTTDGGASSPLSYFLVHDLRLVSVPVPAAAALLTSALGLLGAARRFSPHRP